MPLPTPITPTAITTDPNGNEGMVLEEPQGPASQREREQADALELRQKIAELKAIQDALKVKPEVFDTKHRQEIWDLHHERFADTKCVLVPLEGTLYTIRPDGVVPTEKAVEAFDKLLRSDLKVLLITNSWLKSKSHILKMLEKLGFPVAEDELFTSSDCCKLFLRRHDLKHPYLLVSDSVRYDFYPEYTETLNPLDFDSVVLGLPSTMIDYRLLTKALALLHEGKPLLVLHNGKWEKAIGPCRIPTAGLYARALEFCTDAKKYVPSIPSIGFLMEACHQAGISPKECVLIDHDVTTLHAAKSLCMKTIVIKTGDYKPGDENRYCTGNPDLVIDNFYKAARYLLCATWTDPDELAEAEAERLEREKRKLHFSDFYSRLRAYASNDCDKSKSVCPMKVPSYVW